MTETHLQCGQCGTNPTVCRIDGVAHAVCQCTHVDSDTKMGAVPLDDMDELPDPWEFVEHGAEPAPI